MLGRTKLTAGDHIMNPRSRASGNKQPLAYHLPKISLSWENDPRTPGRRQEARDLNTIESGLHTIKVTSPQILKGQGVL